MFVTTFVIIKVTTEPLAYRQELRANSGPFWREAVIFFFFVLICATAEAHMIL